MSRRHEGYLMIDNRNASVPDEVVREAGLPEGANRGLWETATYTCNHCKVVVVKNPNRSKDKPRVYCRKCNHFICDGCGVTMSFTSKCVTFEQLADEVREAAERQTVPTSLLLIP